MCDQYQGSWLTWLSAACYIVRTNVYFGHGFTPFFLLHGCQPRSANHQLGIDYLQDLLLIESTISQDITAKASVEEAIENDDIDLLVQRLEEIIQLNDQILPAAVARQLTIKQKQAAKKKSIFT
ncbi:hypothetical protein HPULCUR_006098 [Helicostylum pulchrum]|uniref:Uncharacterized protein n=1 Tax=Helicostylum pulchrum TaxID=562976 RepID=A0ABP9Y2X2_9FUNG